MDDALNIDLRFKPEDAAKKIGEAVDDAINRIRVLAAEMIAKLQTVSSVKAADLVALADAERVVITDFTLEPNRQIRQLGLNFDGGWGHRPTDLSEPLTTGSYRAIILVSRRK
jgi:hypothetical protein